MRADRPSVTARYVAQVRAGLPRPLSSEEGAEAEARLYRVVGRAAPVVLPDFRRRMAARTAFVDGEVTRAIGHGIAQVVIVGAGYDGRALRFAHPGVSWFEVDHPATQADKRLRLAQAGVPAPAITFVAVDLTTDDLAGALAAAGFDARSPALVVLEGVIGYLPPATTGDLLTTLAGMSVPGSRLVLTVTVARSGAHPAGRLRDVVRRTGLASLGEAPLGTFAPGRIEAVLAASGWRVARTEHDCEPGRRHRVGVLVAAEPAS